MGNQCQLPPKSLYRVACRSPKGQEKLDESLYGEIKLLLRHSFRQLTDESAHSTKKPLLKIQILRST